MYCKRSRFVVSQVLRIINRCDQTAKKNYCAINEKYCMLYVDNKDVQPYKEKYLQIILLFKQ